MNAFDSLRHDDRPTAPDRRFGERLRAQLTAALTPEIELPERTHAMTDATTAPSTTNPSTTNPSTTAPTTSATSSLVPYVCVHDAAAAMDWYRLVFEATELVRYVGDDGRIGHGELDLGGATLMLADEYPDFGALSPRTIGGTPVKLNLQVPDVDAVWERALANGADAQRPPETQPYGHRSCAFGDPFGHQWMVQTEVSTPTDAEIEAGFGGAFEVVAPDVAAATTPPGPGSPVEIGYVTIPFDDTATARVFYGELFGWVSEDGHLGDLYAHVANTQLPMGMTPGGVEAPVQLYFRVADATAIVDRVVDLGGQVVDRSDAPSGTNVDCIDDQGRRFTIWQPAAGY